MVVGIPIRKLLTLGWRVGGSGRVRILQVGGGGSIDRCGGDGVAMMMWKRQGQWSWYTQLTGFHNDIIHFVVVVVVVVLFVIRGIRIVINGPVGSVCIGGR